jgi:hypothetical protein
MLEEGCVYVLKFPWFNIVLENLLDFYNDGNFSEDFILLPHFVRKFTKIYFPLID